MTRLLIAPALLALIALPDHLWVYAIFAAAVASAMGLGVWACSLRRRLTAAELNIAEAWERVAERDERITRADKVIARLSTDKFAADLAAYDAAVTEPVPFVPADGPHLRLVEASPYDWPQNADDAVWQALYDQNGDPR
jgi:hypothetical protein